MFVKTAKNIKVALYTRPEIVYPSLKILTELIRPDSQAESWKTAMFSV